jgi:acetyl-CoA acetyltransferase
MSMEQRTSPISKDGEEVVAQEFRDRFAIVGVGVSPTTRTGAEGKSAQQLEAWAVKRAIEDCGLRREDIDGAIHAAAQNGSDAYSRKLGLSANFYYPIGRMAGAVAGLFFATQALATGNANYVAVSLGLTWLTQSREAGVVGTADGGSDNKWGMHRDGGGLVDAGWVPTPGASSIHAFLASRHMHEFGTTHEQLGAVALAHRAWANLNPEARYFERTLTMDEYLASPWVCHPYRRHDNCVVSDVGCAFIVTTAERARDLRQQPVFVKGVGFGDSARQAWWDRTNFIQTDGAHAKRVAFEQAGITMDDVDVAELYDCFTGEMILTIEDYGFCAKGDGGPFVESGATAPGGSHPMNTHGGLLSAFHCGDMGNVIEATRQLRGECEDRQVDGAEIALVDGHGWEMILPYMMPVSGAIVLGSHES